MSDTPRTDAATWQTRTPGDPIGASVVYSSFAEGLERELTAAQAQAVKLQERIETLENEKMELQKQLQQFGDNAFENALALVNHRDQLQEENAKLHERIRRLEEGGDKAVRNSYFPDRLAVWNEAKDTQ